MRIEMDKIYCGDSLQVLQTLPENAVDCCCLRRKLWMAAGLFFCPESQKIRDQDSLEQ